MSRVHIAANTAEPQVKWVYLTHYADGFAGSAIFGPKRNALRVTTQDARQIMAELDDGGPGSSRLKGIAIVPSGVSDENSI